MVNQRGLISYGNWSCPWFLKNLIILLKFIRPLKSFYRRTKKKSITRVITFVGNKYTHQLTVEGHSVLRIELEDFSGNKRYAEYSSFSLADVTDNYRIQVTGYTGDAGMWHHYALKFISFLRRTWKTFICSCVTCTNINYSLFTIVRILL